MAAPISNAGIAGRMNIACLLAAIAIIIVLPFRKEIWYDETVSMLCAKGISHDAQNLFTNATLTSADIGALNTPANVFNATLVDNGNSFLYNIGLHWFTAIFGNGISAYMMFSKLCAVAALLAFYALCNLLFNKNTFTSLALLLLALDTDFVAMSHEIRAYSMSILFVTLAAIWFFKFLFREEKPLWLFYTALFSAAAILSHFLTIYIILVFLAVLLLRKYKALFTVKSMLAIILPIGILAIYFYFSYTGIATMNMQNQAIQEKFSSDNFSMSEVIFRSMKIMAMNFKVVFPAFRDNRALFVCSFLFVLTLYIAGIRAANSKVDQRNLHLLFILGAFSSVFLVILSIKSQHYASLYFRYYSFGLPFSCLFVAYLFYVFYSNTAISAWIKNSLLALIVIPVLALFIINIKSEQAIVRYNHVAVAAEIVKNNVSKADVPSWRDAFLLQSVLPKGYKIDYFRSASPDFILYAPGGNEIIPVIRADK